MLLPNSQYWLNRTNLPTLRRHLRRNNHLENQMRPWALGRRNWLFIGSQLAGERAATVMSLLQSAKLNGRDPWAYLKDVLERLPTQLNSRIEELLPHRWQPAG